MFDALKSYHQVRAENIRNVVFSLLCHVESEEYAGR